MKKTKKKPLVRPAGDILLDMEPLLEELIDVHDLQWADVIYLVHGWLAVHRPQAQEQYVEGGSPVLYGYDGCQIIEIRDIK